MIKIMIVEDEQAARERILSMEIFKGKNFFVCASAKNGEEALRLYHQTNPDIIITDIEMPVMNGLEFITAVREENPFIPIIILSCYESFTYAQKAIQLGVQDYLIKDFLEPEVFRSALLRTSGKVPSSPINKKTVSHYKVEKTAILFSLFEENTMKSIEELKRRFTGRHHFSLLLAHIDNYKQNKTDVNIILDKIKEKLETESDGIVSNRGNGMLAILTASQKKRALPDLPTRIIDYVEKHCQTNLTIAANNSFTNLSDIQTVFLSTRDLLRYRIYLGHHRVIIPAHIQNIIWMDPEETERSLHKLKQALIQNRSDIFYKELKTLFDVNASGIIQYNYIEYVKINLLSLLLTYIDTHHLHLSNSFHINVQNFQIIQTLETIDDIHNWFKKHFSEVFALTKNNHMDKIHNVHLREIISFIKTEYQKNLSLEILATKAGIHKVYLSRLFKKETGQTCYEYIQHVRVQKAKEILLSSSMTIAEIAQVTGFKSYDQFAVVFKKLTGDTPTAYRKKYK